MSFVDAKTWTAGSSPAKGKSKLLTPRFGGREVEADVEFLEALGRHRGGGLHQEVLGLLGHREGDDFADVRGVGEQHDDAVDARSRAAMRRRAVAKGLEHAAKPRLDLCRRI